MTSAEPRTRDVIRISIVLVLLASTAVLISGISFSIVSNGIPTPADLGTAVAPTQTPDVLDG